MMMALDIFLLIGQSNMAGRGLLAEVAELSDSRILMLRDGSWQHAAEPLHTDKPERAGVGLGSGFALELLCHAPETTIGLVPCAVGGTPLSRWLPGMDLYEAALSMAKQVCGDGTMKGILWHQGESDANDATLAESYGTRLQTMIRQLRIELGAGPVPFIAGELGTFLAAEENRRPYFNVVNQQLRELETRVSKYGLVDSEELSDTGDNVHFNAISLREFGRRYAQKFLYLAR